MKTVKSQGLKVELCKAEKIRRYLVINQLIRKDLLICKDKKFIYFPVEKKIPPSVDYKIISIDFKKKIYQPRSYKEIINIPDDLMDELPTSYDIIGDIILIKIKKVLDPYKEEIGKALLQTNKHILTIAAVEPIEGELRTREVKIIGGRSNLITLHKEYNVLYKLDIGKVYFSPRLASERKYLSDQVKINEVIIDMFTGIAPFSIMIAKYANPKIIYAIDKNKDAIEYAKDNIKINKVLDKIELINDDSREIIKIFINKEIKPDRIIMNLPFSAYQFFNDTLRLVKNKCIIHYYDILEEKAIPKRIEHLKEIANKKGIELSFSDIRKIKSYAPHEFYIGVDITAKKMPM